MREISDTGAPRKALTPMEGRLLGLLERAADAGLPCPTNLELALEIGRDDVAPLVRALCRKGHIMVESGHQWRVVTLTACGREIASARASRRAIAKRAV